MFTSLRKTFDPLGEQNDQRLRVEQKARHRVLYVTAQPRLYIILGPCPIGIQNQLLILEGAELSRRSTVLIFRRHQINDRLAVPADRDPLAALDFMDELRQFVPGFGDADLHASTIAIR